jgi:inosose dehydratase
MIKIANAPASWGALEFDLEGEAPDYVQVLNEIAETGYAGTELGDWGFMPTDPEKLSQEIHGRNLVLPGAFVPVFLKDPASHQAGIEVAVRTARMMATVEGSLPFIVLADENGRVPERTKNAGRVTPEMVVALLTPPFALFPQVSGEKAFSRRASKQALLRILLSKPGFA